MLVPRTPTQNKWGPLLQQEPCNTGVTAGMSRKARRSEFLGEAAFSYLLTTAKTGCGQERDFSRDIFTILSLWSFLLPLPAGSAAEQGNCSQNTPVTNTEIVFLHQSSQDLIPKL